MLVVHAYCEREIQQMLDLFGWMMDLGGAKNHECVMLAGKNVKDEDEQFMAEIAGEIYGNVERIRPYYEDPRDWPVNANLMWQRAATYIFTKRKCPWFFQEPDCIPLQPKWLDPWQEEYLLAGQPFMGCVVKDPLHLTGNAIYPPDVRIYSSDVMIVETHPWDVTDQNKILPHTHHSELYHHQWFYNVARPTDNSYSRNATHFDNVEQLGIISPKAVLFHRNKDGSLIAMLRARLKLQQAILKAA